MSCYVFVVCHDPWLKFLLILFLLADLVVDKRKKVEFSNMRYNVPCLLLYLTDLYSLNWSAALLH